MTTNLFGGWTNYETFAVAGNLSYTNTSMTYWQDQVIRHRNAAPACRPVLAGVWTVAEAEKYNLADQIRQEIVDESPLARNSLYSELLDNAFAVVDWDTIAEDMLERFLRGDTREQSESNPRSATYEERLPRGRLFDVTETARDVGLNSPTALSAAVWGRYVITPDAASPEHEKSRVWDILSSLRLALLYREQAFNVFQQNGEHPPRPVRLKADYGPDEQHPAVTVMLPYEK